MKPTSFDKTCKRTEPSSDAPMQKTEISANVALIQCQFGGGSMIIQKFL